MYQRMDQVKIHYVVSHKTFNAREVRLKTYHKFHFTGGSSGIGSEEASGAGLYIGIALGLIVVIGLLILGIYFYRWV